MNSSPEGLRHKRRDLTSEWCIKRLLTFTFVENSPFLPVKRQRLTNAINAVPAMTLIETKRLLGWLIALSHCGRVTHICVSKLAIIGSNNGLSPDRRQAIIWTNAGLLLIGPLGTNFSEILIEILTFSFKKMCLKVSSATDEIRCLVCV